MFVPASFISTALRGIVADAADFDGSNDYATCGAGLTNAADSKLFTFVMWTKKDAGSNQIYFEGNTALGGAGTDNRFMVREVSTVFQVVGDNSAGTAILDIATTSVPSTAAWQCLMVSIDLSDAGKRHLYLGDTDELNVTTYTDDTIDFTVADWSVGGRPNGSVKFDGGIAELLFWTGAYIDLSVEANRRMFIDADGKPVHPATAIATLGTPDVYFHLDDGETANNFVANDDGGDGGAFTVTGALTTYASSPSD